MDIWIGSLLEGAQQARGAVAIIDVLRAFTTAAAVIANGASRIIMVGDVTEAMKLRDAGLGQVCIGEVGGRAPPGFDFGNSPFEVSDTDFAGKTIIQRTSAGTQGIVAAARHAQVLYAASLVTATATARALLSHRADRIALVAMGSEAVARSDEDELCALHLRNLLEGRPGNPAAVRDVILAGGDVLRFHDPGRPYLDRHDLEIALDVDRYDFAIRVTMENGLPVARRER
ncbi:MAG: 2-phosphosulfolactate phosphatase [Xanthobacteraceae bacterium]